MMLVTYHRSLDEDLRRLLKELDLKAFAEASKILGIGRAADAGFSMAWPGHCAIILSPPCGTTRRNRCLGYSGSFGIDCPTCRGE